MMRFISALLLVSLTIVSGTVHAKDPYICPSNGAEIQQLRIYEINRANRDAFHGRFQDHAIRIMKRHEFEIIDMWESDAGETLQFVYLLGWPDQATMDLRWKEFMADQEWIDIKKVTGAESGQFVLSVKGQPLERVAYSPACRPT